MSNNIRSVKQLDHLLATRERVIVMFYADWCTSCHRFAPHFERLASAHTSTIPFAKIDIEEMEEVTRRFDIEPVPVFMLFYKGKEARRITGLRTDIQETLDDILQL